MTSLSAVVRFVSRRMRRPNPARASGGARSFYGMIHGNHPSPEFLVNCPFAMFLRSFCSLSNATCNLYNFKFTHRYDDVCFESDTSNNNHKLKTSYRGDHASEIESMAGLTNRFSHRGASHEMALTK